MNCSPLHDGKCATHRVYYLTCEDFAALTAACENRCAICRITGNETKYGYLFIDHDNYVGQWAVRGLLCALCNARIDAFGHVRTSQELAYLADPWFRRRFAELGVNIEVRPEPPLGSTVTGRGNRRWRRTARGWEQGSCYRVLTWKQLNNKLGPHSIRSPAS